MFAAHLRAAPERSWGRDLADPLEPSPARFLDLHVRVVNGDRVALNKLAGELWLPLCRRLRRSFPRAAADVVADASNDAILTYAARPAAFDASRQVPLQHFLYGIAARILRDRLRSDERRVVRESEYADHFLQSIGDRTDDGAMAGAAVQQVRGALQLVCNASELRAMVAWLNEDDTEIIAVCLGVSNLRPSERRREAKRFIDRVIKRLRRHFGGRATHSPLACIKKSEWLTSNFTVRRLIHH